MKNNGQSWQFTIDDTPSTNEINLIRKKLNTYNRDQTDGAYDQPGIEINLALKNTEDEVIGGIIVSTMLHVMHLEVLWVAEKFRKQGYGRELVLAAESIGCEKGSLTSHTWTFEFQGPEFYPKVGYELVGIYDGYPNDLKEYVFKKHLGDLKDPLERNGSTIISFSNGFYITDIVTKDEIEILHAGLRSHVDQYVGDEKNGIGIKLLIRDEKNQVIGGLHAWTTIQNLLVEFVWIDAAYRCKGLGTRLLVKAEINCQKEWLHRIPGLSIILPGTRIFPKSGLSNIWIF